jgi:type IV secretory pathway VirB6-like protein
VFDIISSSGLAIIKLFTAVSSDIVTNCYPIIGELVYHLLIAFGVLYVIWTAIRYYLMVGGDPDLRVMFTTVFKIMICIGISGSYETFYNFFYSPLMDFFQGLPVIVVKASMGNKVGSYDDVLKLLHEVVIKFSKKSFEGINQSYFSFLSSSIIDGLFGLVLGIIFITLSVSFVVINVLSIISANLILMLAPLVIGLAAFEPTKKYASNMVNSFITYAMRPTFSAVAIAVVVFVLNKMNLQSVEATKDLSGLLAIITVGIVGIALQLKTEEFSSAITGGVSSASSGVMSMAGGAVAGYQLGKRGAQLGGRVAEGARSAGGVVANGAIKAFEGVKHRYMQV